MRITADQIREHIRSRMEDADTPRIIVEVLRQFEGKRLDKRVIDKMIERGVDRPVLRKQTTRAPYRLVHIIWGDYGVGNGGYLYVSHQNSGHVTIVTDDIIEHNPSYFDARVERNNKRQRIIDDPDALEMLATAMNNFAAAKQNLQNILAIDGTFDFDRYSLAELVGLNV